MSGFDPEEQRRTALRRALQLTKVGLASWSVTLGLAVLLAVVGAVTQHGPFWGIWVLLAAFAAWRLVREVRRLRDLRDEVDER